MDTETPASAMDSASPPNGGEDSRGRVDLIDGARFPESDSLLLDAAVADAPPNPASDAVDAPAGQDRLEDGLSDAVAAPPTDGNIFATDILQPPPFSRDAPEARPETAQNAGDARMDTGPSWSVDLGPPVDGNASPRWRQVRSSFMHSCAIRNDHTLWCWGNNTMTQLGDGTSTYRPAPVQVQGQTWNAVAVGMWHTAALDTSGTLYVWGDNQYGESGSYSGGGPTTKPTKLSGTYDSVFAGGSTTCALRADGVLACWGEGDYGQLGNGTTNSRGTSTITGPWVTAAMGARHVCAIKPDSTLWCWGYNGMGQLGIGSQGQQTSPVQVGGTGWTTVTCGPVSTCATKSDGSLWCWGENHDGQLGDGTTSGRLSPIQAPGDGWQRVTMGGPWFDGGHTCAIRSDSTLWCWGGNAYGQLGDGSTVEKRSPTQVSGNWAQISAGITATCGIDLDGVLACWGRNVTGALGIGLPGNLLTPTLMPGGGWSSVATVGLTNSGWRHICGTKTDGTLWCWGDGPLGDGSEQSSTVPIQIGESDWAQVAVAHGYTCALKTDHTLWCWGYNNYGEVKAPAGADVLVPTQITGASWASVSTGLAHACATQTDGTLWCWGSLSSSGLGTSGLTQIPGTSWSEVSAGWSYTCATQADNSIWCWGDNSRGRLGLGPTAGQTVAVPTKVTGGSWSMVSAGEDTTAALKSDGTLWTWGYNAYDTNGLVFQGTPTPVQGMGSDWTSIRMGASHLCGLRGSTLWCWGVQTSGGVGNGIDNDSFLELPTELPGADWVSVSTGEGDACAIRSDHSLWCWGYNLNGMLQQDAAWRTTPTPVIQ